MKDKPINLLSLTAIHHKLPEFYMHIAAHLYILLDPPTSLEELTIDGKYFLNKFLLTVINELCLHLPSLFLVLSMMFSGCDNGEYMPFSSDYLIMSESTNSLDSHTIFVGLT
jgi:hypothetical protein